jgi:polyphosphate kinase 2
MGGKHTADGSVAGMSRKDFQRELAVLQVEPVKMLDWIRATGHRLVVLFEGRDAAGKGGTIKRIADPLNPRFCRVAALPAPTERERTQWYFQRYVAHLPAAGEIVLFDRSWYNRAGVERVMGFCTDKEYWEFLRSVPEFEPMLSRSGIQLVKYWVSVSDEEQERRFRARIEDRSRRWKLSPLDLHSRSRWVDYSRAKDLMIEPTSTPESPWYEVDADFKRRARLNCISHLLSLVPLRGRRPPADRAAAAPGGPRLPASPEGLAELDSDAVLTGAADFYGPLQGFQAGESRTPLASAREAMPHRRPSPP